MARPYDFTIEIADSSRKRLTNQAGETAMTNSSKRTNRVNSRDEWALAIFAIVVPIVSLLSISI